MLVLISRIIFYLKIFKVFNHFQVKEEKTFHHLIHSIILTLLIIILLLRLILKQKYLELFIKITYFV